ncbi:hypothetical protein B0H11DRAFT_2041316 [Mycena galericulata]|nr:hypothetical protein B0H11DRAFT_2041316 [Mycena galericulata]
MANSSPDPSTCALDAFRTSITEHVAAALPPLTVEQAYSGVDYDKKGADFTIALPRFKLGKPEDVGAKFQPDDYIELLTLDNAFLHFQCKSTTLIRDVLTQGKKVIIEYSSLNIAKSFHVGHLRSTIIGGFLANLYKACGWEVISMNYLGDWGTHLEKDAIKHLFDVYVKVNKDAEADPEVKAEAVRWFKRMEDGDESALKNWRVWRALSVKKYTEEYDRLNIKFDAYTGESMVGKKWQDKALARLEEMGLIEDVDGAKIVNLEQWKMGKAVLRKRGHVNYGLVQGMSTRKGTVVFLDQIIREAGQVMHEQMQKNEEKYKAVVYPETVSREIRITGVKIQDMAAKRNNNYTFNWDRMKSFEGDTGQYLQYAHVRLSSISRKNPHLLPLPLPSQIDTSSLATSSHARDIVFLLGTYPDIVKVALKTQEPAECHAISSAWEVLG